jgi:hypothetical protein
VPVGLDVGCNVGVALGCKLNKLGTALGSIVGSTLGNSECLLEGPLLGSGLVERTKKGLSLGVLSPSTVGPAVDSLLGF